jgi:hypothetical protein
MEQGKDLGAKGPSYLPEFEKHGGGYLRIRCHPESKLAREMALQKIFFPIDEFSGLSVASEAAESAFSTGVEVPRSALASANTQGMLS